MFLIRHVTQGRDSQVNLTSGYLSEGANTRTSGIALIQKAQEPFAHYGYCEKHDRWWARNDGDVFEIHYWWLELPAVPT